MSAHTYRSVQPPRGPQNFASPIGVLGSEYKGLPVSPKTRSLSQKPKIHDKEA